LITTLGSSDFFVDDNVKSQLYNTVDDILLCAQNAFYRVYNLVDEYGTATDVRKLEIKREVKKIETEIT
jgi:hypothetical protein